MELRNSIPLKQVLEGLIAEYSDRDNFMDRILAREQRPPLKQAELLTMEFSGSVSDHSFVVGIAQDGTRDLVWYELREGAWLDNGSELVPVESGKVTEAEDDDVSNGWVCRWFNPLVTDRLSHGPWHGPFGTKEDALIHVRGEYE